MPSGKVKWFNSKKGYGFITDDETNKDIFLHVSALEDSKLRVLKEEQKIEFDIKEKEKKLQKEGFFKVIKMKSTYEKPSERKKRLTEENIKRVKKLQKLKNRI